MTLVACLAMTAFASAPVRGKDACSVVRAPDARAIAVPFSVVDGRIYVQAKVNGKGPFRFAVDTGASGVGRLDASLLPKLGLESSGTAATSDGVATAEVETTAVESLSVGSIERKDLSLITRDYRKHVSGEAAFDGILGRAFFADGLLVIDYGARKLSFSKSSGLSRNDKGVLPYERAFRVPITIGDKSFEANLDSGANVAMVVPARLWPEVSGSSLEKAASGQLTNGKIETSKGVVPGPVKAGAMRWFDVDAKVSERFPEILIGAHALSSSVLAIDQRSRSIALCPN
ncbi:aspartyl protease family protein [Luteibacter jiangsuensis]|nr:aspartyl protease family protein [Luteibacter jiangsuensis]